MGDKAKAKARPGLKQLTPWEQALVERMSASSRAMWQDLLARNRWQPAPEKGQGQGKTSAKRKA